MPINGMFVIRDGVCNRLKSRNGTELQIGPLMREFDEGYYRAEIYFRQCVQSPMKPIHLGKTRLNVLQPVAG